MPRSDNDQLPMENPVMSMPGLSSTALSVMAGLVPAIHVCLFRGFQGKTWMPGTRPGMTEEWCGIPISSACRAAAVIATMLAAAPAAAEDEITYLLPAPA